jgi:hypothetical protein
MIARGQDIYAAFQQLVCCVNGEAKPSGSVFSVGDHEVDALVPAQGRDQGLNGMPPWFAYNVTHHQYPQKRCSFT